jgi:hypothetical protein
VLEIFYHNKSVTYNVSGHNQEASVSSKLGFWVENDAAPNALFAVSVPDEDSRPF